MERRLKISSLIEVVAAWAADKPLVDRVYLFGSRVRGDTRPDSAIAIAVELDLEELAGRDDTGGVDTWTSESPDWIDELQVLIPIKVDLQCYLGDETPVIKEALRRSHVLAYEKPGKRPPRWLDSFKVRMPRSRLLLGH